MQQSHQIAWERKLFRNNVNQLVKLFVVHHNFLVSKFNKWRRLKSAHVSISVSLIFIWKWKKNNIITLQIHFDHVLLAESFWWGWSQVCCFSLRKKQLLFLRSIFQMECEFFLSCSKNCSHKIKFTECRWVSWRLFVWLVLCVWALACIFVS